MKVRYLVYALPVIVLVALLALFMRGLFLNPTIVPSPLIGKSVPTFSLPRLHDPAKSVTQNEFRNQVALLNVWATWCVACRDEHETLVQFSKQNIVPIYGLDYKDDRQTAIAWLAKEGDPYKDNAFDESGDVAINWGVYGAPETFLIDKHGIIRHKYIGPLTPDIIKNDLLPRIHRLEQE